MCAMTEQYVGYGGTARCTSTTGCWAPETQPEGLCGGGSGALAGPYCAHWVGDSQMRA